MEFLLGPITWRINVLYESRMKWTWHHSKLAVEEVSFFGGLRVVLLQLSSIHDRAVGVTSPKDCNSLWARRYELGCGAPMVMSVDKRIGPSRQKHTNDTWQDQGHMKTFSFGHQKNTHFCSMSRNASKVLQNWLKPCWVTRSDWMEDMHEPRAMPSARFSISLRVFREEKLYFHHCVACLNSFGFLVVSECFVFFPKSPNVVKFR